MKSRIALFALALAAAMSLAACTENSESSESASGSSEVSSAEVSEAAEKTESSSEETAEESSAAEVNSSENETAENDSSKADEMQEKNLPIEKGLWWAVGSDTDAYYELHSDGSGAVMYQDIGSGVGFDCEPDGENGLIFHFGDADNSTHVSFETVDEYAITVTFDGGEPEDWLWMGDLTLEEFPFYSNTELTEMAREYLKASTNEETEYAYAEIDENGMIVIQLFDVVDGHNSTAAWYTVDRFTGLGADGSGRQIDLTDPPVG